MTRQRSAAPSHPDPEPVGDHLVIDKVDWVPGADPDPHRRVDGQRAYAEPYFRCILCGEERLSRDAFPDDCDRDVESESEALDQEAES